MENHDCWPRVSVVLTLAAVVFLSGCERAAESRPAPPPTVTVSRPLNLDVIQWDAYSAYLSSPDTSNVEARVSGLVEEAPFQEGAIVHKGDLLFQIDPRQFQADYDSKKAAVSQATSIADQARVHLRRYAEVVGTRAVSQDDYDSAKASYEEARASLEAAGAALEASSLYLQWTRVTAPISGRISRMNVQVGNLVNGGSGQATLLTTIVSIDPIYCYINVPESAALRYQVLAIQEKYANVAGAAIPCFLELENETSFSHGGVIDFVDNQIDTSTGTVQMRGVFANPTGLLTPGLFALMRIPGSGRYKALLIPDEAVNTDQNERFVLIVDKDGLVQRRPVKLGALFGTLRSITDGLRSDEWVIVNGVQSAQPGVKVKPHEALVPTKSLEALESTPAGSTTRQARPETRPATEPPAQQASGGTP
jgi:RND family efflux transporter MFP subunit